MKNYSEYFPVDSSTSLWGIFAKATGRAEIPPQSPYPPPSHPEDHLFSWEKGRIIQDYQLVWIEKGSGRFETSTLGFTPISPGSLLILFPGVWHRYRPNLRTGWTEHWIELQGSYIQQLQDNRIINPKKPFGKIHCFEEVFLLFEQIRNLCVEKPPQFAVQMGLIGIEIISLLNRAPVQKIKYSHRIKHQISQAQTLLFQQIGSPVSFKQLATKCGVSYSYFRREFKRQTGFTPKNYQIELRLRRSKDLLLSTHLTIDEISSRLGYTSPFHFSKEFYQKNKQRPSYWRKLHQPLTRH